MGKKNSLRDIDVRVIIGLLKKGYNNQNTLKIINRNRQKDNLEDINSGRISDVKNRHNKKYNNNNNVVRYRNFRSANKTIIEEFLEISSDQEKSNFDIISDNELDSLVKIISKNPVKIDSTETQNLEFKQTLIEPKKFLKTIVSFANSNGGYIIFGVADDGKVLGIKGKDLTSFNQYDFVRLSDLCVKYFDTAINIKKRTYRIHNKTVGVFYIPPYTHKPIIIARDGEGINAGIIYYRYPGESRAITKEDLNKIIEERIKKQAEEKIPQLLERIFKIGIDNIAIMNTDTGVIEGAGGKFVIDDETLKKVSFIKEGDFTEGKGSPTLKLIGDLESVDRQTIIQKEVDKKTLYPYLPQRVAEKVVEKTGNDKFVVSYLRHFVSHYKLKSEGNAESSKYCYHDAIYDNYSYSQSWVDKVSEDLGNLEKLKEILSDTSVKKLMSKD